MTTPMAGCPKQMVYGPCGGVRDDGGCELGDRRCPFADLGAAVVFEVHHPVGTDDVPDHSGSPSGLLDLARQRAVVLTDLTVTPFDHTSVESVLARLEGSCDAVLVGEHQNRPDFPPAVMAQLIAAAGHRAWITLSCRDRNRLVLEQDIAGLREVGVDGVLCVTGDARAPGIRPGVTQVFDVDGTGLTAIAAAAGLPVGVPEAPAARPTAVRPGRLAQKQRAGARLGVLNHVAGTGELNRFARAARAAGATLPLIASVAIYTDEPSAGVLLRFPGLQLDRDRVAAVLSSPDPLRAGIDAAVDEARELLAIDGVVGVNISGPATARGVEAAAEVKAEVGRRIKEWAA